MEQVLSLLTVYIYSLVACFGMSVLEPIDSTHRVELYVECFFVANIFKKMLTDFTRPGNNKPERRLSAVLRNYV